MRSGNSHIFILFLMMMTPILGVVPKGNQRRPTHVEASSILTSRMATSPQRGADSQEHDTHNTCCMLDKKAREANDAAGASDFGHSFWEGAWSPDHGLLLWFKVLAAGTIASFEHGAHSLSNVVRSCAAQPFAGLPNLHCACHLDRETGATKRSRCFSPALDKWWQHPLARQSVSML